MRSSFLTFPFFLLLLTLTASIAAAGSNAPDTGVDQPSQVISITDSGWTTSTSSNDCVSGWADDSWQLTLTQPSLVTISVADCCCPGDFFEVYVDDQLIGTTPNLAPPWGCDFQGPLSSGSFGVTLCPGTHSIRVRDAGFDGHSLADIQAQGMCPAGFTVSGTVAPTTPSPPQTTDERVFVDADYGEEKPMPPEAKEIQDLLFEIEPFVEVDEGGFQALRLDDARRAHLPRRSLEFAHELVALNNRIALAARSGQPLELERSDFALVEPLYRYLAEGGSPCGDRRNPSACPARQESAQFFSTDVDVVHHLEALGYHRTPSYAGGGLGNDYTLVVPHPECGSGPFRNQALVYRQGACWTYNTQGPEPNPEILAYSWPYLTWGTYVFWWHAYFC